MTASRNAQPLQIIERQHGTLLRLQTSGADAMEVAVDLLGFLEAELEAEIEDSGWKSGHGLKVAGPVLIELEGLEVEVTTDGSGVTVRRVAGSGDEFEELCDLIVGEFHRD